MESAVVGIGASFLGFGLIHLDRNRVDGVVK